MTRFWRRIVGIVALAALAGGPAMAVMCAARCLPAAPHAAMAMHHGASCHETAPASQTMTGAPAHDCATHDGAVRESETVVASARVDLQQPAVLALPAAALVDAPAVRTRYLHAHDARARSSSARVPLVLRI